MTAHVAVQVGVAAVVAAVTAAAVVVTAAAATVAAQAAQVALPVEAVVEDHARRRGEDAEIEEEIGIATEIATTAIGSHAAILAQPNQHLH